MTIKAIKPTPSRGTVKAGWAFAALTAVRALPSLTPEGGAAGAIETVGTTSTAPRTAGAIGATEGAAGTGSHERTITKPGSGLNSARVPRGNLLQVTEQLIQPLRVIQIEPAHHCLKS